MNPGGGQIRPGEPGEQIAWVGDLYGADHEPAQRLGITALGSHGTQLYDGAGGAEPAGSAVYTGFCRFGVDG